MKNRTPVNERFWKYVHKTDTCWLWIGAKTHGGYGVIKSGGRSGKIIRAHRLSWEIHYGAIPDGLDMCHTCDNPACVRPDHLFLGTPSDNAIDMINKGRDLEGRKNRARGTIHHNAKLSDEKVIAIRAEYATGETSLNRLAHSYGVSKRTILNIVHLRIWRHAK